MPRRPGQLESPPFYRDDLELVGTPPGGRHFTYRAAIEEGPQRVRLVLGSMT